MGPSLQHCDYFDSSRVSLLERDFRDRIIFHFILVDRYTERSRRLSVPYPPRHFYNASFVDFIVV